jgi:hypothetical protein
MTDKLEMPLEQFVEAVSKENDRLRQEIERLRQYESTVKFIANDYVELSYEKAQWQRDDWWKRCNKTIATAEYDK